MGRMFWLMTAVLVGVITHVSYVLFMPSYVFSRHLNQSTDGQPYNQFFIADPTKQTSLLPSATSKSIVGLCKFDLSLGPIELLAKLPRAYWTLSIYAQSGRQVYSLNDVQAGTSEFKVELSRSKSFLEQVLRIGRAEEPTQTENLGWHAETAEPRGIAVIWIPISDDLMRPQIEAVMKGSTCKPIGG